MLRYFRQRRNIISSVFMVSTIIVLLLWVLRAQAQTTYQVLVTSELDGTLAALAGNGTCELREAIRIVNLGNDAGSDCAFVPAGVPDLTLDDFEIRFATGTTMPSQSVIQLVGPLPVITSTLDIAGFDVPNPFDSVTIEPAPGVSIGVGLDFAPHPTNPLVNADNSGVFGMIIRGFGIGIRVTNLTGVQIGRDNATVTDLENYIYDNDFGIVVQGAQADGTLISNNFIGVDEFSGAMGNTMTGIVVHQGARNTLIGGSIGLATFGNTISDNGQMGIAVRNADTVTISNNIVGLETAGSLNDFGNGTNGIGIFNTVNAILDSNTVGFSGTNGILISGSPNTLLSFNSVGTFPNTNANIGNTLQGIAISNSNGTQIIGGAGAGQFTRVGFNGRSGISVVNSVRVAIEDSIIFQNGGLGIDLNGNGVTLNDGAGDGDGGANSNQNFPVLSSAGAAGATLVLNGSLPTSAGNYDIIFYENTSCDPSGYGEGERFLMDGGAPYVLNTGPGAFNVTLTGGPYPIGNFITAIAVSQNAATLGNTSEFSLCIPITDATLMASFTPTNITVAPGTTVNFTNTSTGAITDTRWYVNSVLVSNTYNFSQLFTVPGTYTIELQIENSAFPGVISSAFGTVIVVAPTATPVPPTTVPPATPVPPTLTFTPIAGIPTETFTPIPPTLTFTPIPPTATFTPLPTLTFTPIPPTATFTPLPTLTFTPIPPTATFTPIPPTATFTPLPPTATATLVPTATDIPPTATLIPTLTSTPDLQVTVSGDGENTMNVRVINDGQTDARNVVVQNELRPNVRYQAAIPGSPICTEIAGLVTCRLGTLGAGESDDVTIQVGTNGEAPDSGTTSVSADGVRAIIIDEPYISKIGTPPIAPPGEEITYIIRVINPTRETATDMLIQDEMPDIIEILDANASAGVLEIDGQRISLTLDELGPGERVVLTINARVSDDQEAVDAIINEACVSSSSNTGRDCARMTFLAVGELPPSGEVPLMILLLRWSIVLGLSALMIAGIGLLYWRMRRQSLSQ